MTSKPIDDELYHFVVEHNTKYYPVWFGWIMPEMVRDFEVLKDEQTFVRIEVVAPGHRFIYFANKPLFMFNILKNAAEYASDSSVLDLYPDGNKTNKRLERYMLFPEYFDSGVSSLFEYKMHDQLYKRINNAWQPMNI